MINGLRIVDFAALAKLELELGPGLNVLSGASGQGKSTVLEALRFVCGLERTKGLGRLVRRGAKQARVELRVCLEPKRLRGLAPRWATLADAGELHLVRTVDTRGRSRAQAGGEGHELEAITLAELREVGQRLAEVYGQGSAPRIVDEAVQRELLDGASRLKTARERFAEVRRALLELAAERDTLADELERRVAEDEAEFDTREVLESLDPRPDEHDTLLAREEDLRDVSAWCEGLAELGTLFRGPGAEWTQRLARVTSRLEADPDDPVLGPLTEALNLLELSQGALDERLEALADQRVELQQILARLGAYRSAARRLGGTPGELAARWAALQDAPSVTELGARLRRLDRELAEAWAVAVAAGTKLSAGRARAARKLEKAVAPRLSELGLERGRFRIRVEANEAKAPAWTHASGQPPPRPHRSNHRAEDSLSPQSVHPQGAPALRGAVAEVEQHLPAAHGLDLTAFEFSPDPTVELAPLAQASGGELSRLFLALGERAAGDAPVLVFDEIDQNLGARLGSQVGDCLADLGAGRQVLVVTHLAPVAARAQVHLGIRRQGGAVVAEPLEGTSRIEELALMIRGEPVTPAARRQAQELLREVRSPVARPQRRRRRRAKSA